MKHQPHQAIEEIQEALEIKIGRQLQTLYLFGSAAQEKYEPGLSDVNLLAIVENGTDVHDIREALRPIWQEHHQTLRRMPLIAAPSAIKRHLQLNPVMAAHLLDNRRLLAGQPFEINTRPPSPGETIGNLVQTAINATAAIAPQLLPQNQIETTQETLHRLANRLDINVANGVANSPVDGTDIINSPIVGTIAAIQAHLAQMVEQQSDYHWQEPAPPDPPPLLDNLLGIYEFQDRVIFLLPDWPPNQISQYISQIDWAAVAENLEGQYQGLHITTPTQLRLFINHYRAAEYYLENYNHAWGLDPLAALEIPHWRVINGLGRFASQFEIGDFPHAYITADDDRLGRLIHDYQNRLLNIQLREELMSRIDQRPRVTAPTNLPDRTAPQQTRIDALFHHFHWWADHYTALMQNERTQSTHQTKLGRQPQVGYQPINQST